MEAAKTRGSIIPSAIEGEAFWKEHARWFKESGQSRAKYCRLNKLDYDRFSYWLGKWKHTSSLVPVKLKVHEVGTALCTFKLSNGTQIIVHDLQVLPMMMEKVI